jgi:hypothetical protein
LARTGKDNASRLARLADAALGCIGHSLLNAYRYFAK